MATICMARPSLNGNRRDGGRFQFDSSIISDMINKVSAHYNVEHPMGIKQIYVIMACYFFYYLQDIIYPSSSIVSQALLLYIALYGMDGLRKQSMSIYRTTTDVLWLLFISMLTITFIVSPKTVMGNAYHHIGLVDTINQFKNAIVFCLLFFVGKRLYATGRVTDKSVALAGLALLLLSVIRFFYTKDVLIEEYGSGENTNNAAYCFVSYLPFLPIVLKEYKKLGIMSIFVAVGFLLSGAKRGAILCAAVAAVVSVYFLIKNKKMKFKLILSGLIVCIPLYFFVAKEYSENDYLQKRVEDTKENKSSGRDVAYTMLWGHWVNDQNIVTQLFGNGSAQSVAVWGNYAHNDWLELLIDNGLVGCLLYFAIFISLFRQIHRTKIGSIYQLTLYLSVLMWLMKTIYSMGYTSIDNGIMMVVLGIYLQKHAMAKRWLSTTKR
jgi:hypothetical protein